MKANNIRYIIELLKLRKESLLGTAAAAEEQIPDKAAAHQTGVEIRTVIRREQDIMNELENLFYERSTVHELGCECTRCRDYATRAAVQGMQNHMVSSIRRHGKKSS